MTSTSKSSTPKIINFADLDLTKLSFSERKKNKYGGNYVNILYDGNILPVVVFPRMKSSFGISAMEDPKNPEKVSYSLETSFDNKNPTSELKEVYKKALEFDKFIKDSIVKNYKTWLPDYKNKDAKYVRDFVIEDKYFPMVKLPKDKERQVLEDYPSRLKSTLYLNKNKEFSFKCFDENKLPININSENYKEVVSAGDELSTMRMLKQIWFGTSGFGVTWDIKQMRVFKTAGKFNSCMLNSDNEDSEEEATAEEEMEEEVEEISDEE